MFRARCCSSNCLHTFLNFRVHDGLAGFRVGQFAAKVEVARRGEEERARGAADDGAHLLGGQRRRRANDELCDAI